MELPGKKIKILIVDDMPPAREGLRIQLEMLDNIEIVGEAGNVDDALEIVLSSKPHLIFLDINLPLKTGFDLLDELKKYPETEMDVIFVSGYERHAIRSFEYYPFNFLLKPVASQKLREVVNNYTDKKFKTNFNQRIDEYKKLKDKLYFKGEEGHLWVNPEEILWFKADRNYTEIYLRNGEIEVISENLGSIQKIIPETIFYKTHRSFIVNLNHIRKVVRRNGNILLNHNPFDEYPLIAKENIIELVNLLGR